MSSGLEGWGRAGDDPREPLERGRLVQADPRDLGVIDRRLAPVCPPEAESRAAGHRLEIGGCGDGPDPRHRQPPTDVLVGLPVYDLLERCQAAGHALRDSPDATAPTGEGLVDDERALPSR